MFTLRRPGPVFLIAVAALLVASCSRQPEQSVNPPPASDKTLSTPVSSTISPPTDTATVTSLPDVDGCPPGEVMVTEGQLLRSERPAADGTRISGITWRTTGNCHVLSVSFASDDGAPATTAPTVTARLLRSEGVLRVETAATSSVVADQKVEEGLVDRLFVPRTPDGTRFVDFVLDGPVLARAHILTSPARLEIEVEPGGPPVGRPLITDDLVIVQPGSAAVMAPILDVSGYASGPSISLVLSVSMGSVEVEEDTFEVPSGSGAWTAFSTALQMGERRYDNLRISRPDGTVVAGIPFNPPE